MLRSEYMDQYGTGTSEQDAALHRAYYAQFVTDTTREMVRSRVGEGRIMGGDPHFNDIPLDGWDRLVPYLTADVRAAVKAAGDTMTPCVGVCILKEAAQQIREGK